MNHVDIVSRFGLLTLRLTPVPRPDDVPPSERPAWEARLLKQGLDATIVTQEDPDEPQTLIEFMNEIYAERLGWDGKREWRSRFGALTIVADHDQINTVRLYVQLSGGVIPQWTAYAELHVDPGRFHRVAANLELFNAALADEQAETVPGAE